MIQITKKNIFTLIMLVLSMPVSFAMNFGGGNGGFYQQCSNQQGAISNIGFNFPSGNQQQFGYRYNFSQVSNQSQYIGRSNTYPNQQRFQQPYTVANNFNEDDFYELPSSQQFRNVSPIFHKDPKNLQSYNKYLSDAAKAVKECEKRIMRKLNLPHNWKNSSFIGVEKAKYKNVVKKGIIPTPYLEKIYPKVQKVLNCMQIRTIFGIQEIKRCNSHIAIHTQRQGLIILCLTSGRSRFGSTIGGDRLFIDFNYACRASTEEIESTILHELGHIYYDHNFRHFLLKNLYKYYGNSKYTKEAFNTDLLEFSRAIEKQADLFIMLGDLIIGKKAELAYRRMLARKEKKRYDPSVQVTLYEDVFTNKASTHPSLKQRINYIREVNNAMEREMGIIFNKTNKQVKVNNSIPPKIIFELGKLEMELGEFYKAACFFSTLYNTSPNNVTPRQFFKNYENYALMKQKIKEKNINAVMNIFNHSGLLSQNINTLLRVKSCLAVGNLYFELPYCEKLKAEQCLKLAKNQNICIKTHQRAKKILKEIKKRDQKICDDFFHQYYVSDNLGSLLGIL